MATASSPCHNRTFYQTWIQADANFSRLILKNVDVIPFVTDFSSATVSACSFILCSARIMMTSGDIDDDKAMTLHLGETLAPLMSADRYLDQQTARNELVIIVRWILNHLAFNPEILANINFGQFPETVAACIAAGVPANGFSRATATRNTAPSEADIQALTVQEAAAYLMYLGERSMRRGAEFPVEMITATMLATVKQGNATQKVLTKITQAVRNELGFDITLNADVLRMYHLHFSTSITPRNIGGVFEQWTAWLPAIALRLTLMVQQAQFSGLTSFCVTGKALRLFRDFPWGRFSRLVPGEVLAFVGAINAVNGNAYYGFCRDLGAAKSTNYKNLTWVAKELLIRINGDESLKNYKGWTKRPKQHDALTAMIEEFVEAQSREPPAGEEPAEALDLFQAVDLQMNANLFA